MDDEDLWEAEPFDLDAFTNREIRNMFRFSRPNLERLRTALRIPDQIITKTRDNLSGMEALCIMLRRLSYPNRWMDIRKIFGRSQLSLS